MDPRPQRAKSILLVDDDASGRAMLGLSLRQAGYAVQAASSGEEALDLLKDHAYDWLVTDGRMNAMDGIELSRLAKLLNPAIHIVMVSAMYDSGDIQCSPIEKIFSKPVHIEAMLDWMSRHSA